MKHKSYILMLFCVFLLISCTTMAKSIGYIEPGIINPQTDKEELKYCSLTYPGLLERAVSELKEKSKKSKFQNLSLNFYSENVIFNCVRIEYEK
ncbi:hypothetical protein EHQ96_16790 [Leptospira levettii]|uniref:hypothetical protein n=1 Tax=Leptospira levettii TaxID=2023178 RepID=UPI001082FA88|nr:hypothetical protein [Leptospira levettii]TGM65480.1 hypothetical protein EHQ96_16790 [Leptospira levettii]